MNFLEPTLEDKFILTCCALEHNDRHHEVMDSIDASFDWEYFAAEGNRQAVNPWMYKQIKKNDKLKSLVPENIYTTLQNEYYYTLNRNTKIFKELENILKILNDEGIDVILLKGAYLLPFVYEDLGARTISDIDLLVKSNDIDNALEVLKKTGFKHNFIPYSKWHKNYIIKHEKHVAPLRKNNIKIDLHCKFDFYGYYKDIENSWETAINKKYKDNHFYCLSEKNLTYLFTSHFIHHYYEKKDAQIKGLIDIYLFSHYMKNDIVIFNTHINNCFDLLKIEFHKGGALKKINGNNKDINNESYSVFKRFSNIKGIQSKMIFLFYIIFPNKDFMKLIYPNKKTLLYAYFIRWSRLISKYFLI